MPLCPQITNTPITVSLTSDFTVTNVVPVLPANTEQLAQTDANVAAAVATANAAAATAGAAQATATTALADAATALTTAQNSLQPSAFAIQNPTTKQLSAIDATGLTVYVNSPTTGARVVMNSAGLAGFNSGGSATFSISASTGAAVFSGSVTGSTITASTMNIGGNAIIDSSGLLTATGATITGTINATAGYFGTSTNGWSISSTGLVGVGTGTIVTSTGANAIVLSSTDNAVGIKSGGSYAGWIGSIGSGAILIHYGTSPSSSAYPRAAMSSTAGTLSGTASSGYSANTDGTNTIAGTSRFFNSVQIDQSITAGSAGSLFEFLSSSGNVRVAQTYSQSVSGRAMQISSAGLYGTTASTRRKKHDISSYTINSAALLNLDVKTFKYIPEIDAAQDVQYGFIAEEAEELGLDELIQYDSSGQPDYFAYEKLPIFLLQLIKELKAEINQLKGE